MLKSVREATDEVAGSTRTATGRPRAAAPVAAAAPSLRRVGDAVGRYTLLEVLGRGAMGVVFAAVDRELDRRVAIKLLLAPPSGAVDLRRRARLQREARSIAATVHPNVVGVFDVGVDGQDDYIVMEWIDGVDLRHWLAGPEHPLAVGIDVMLQAARGLAAAHTAGIVHRDFKPANVVVARDGRVRVLDFGLARAGQQRTDDDDDVQDSGSTTHAPPASVTHSRERVGTPAYMAPEQHLGHVADAASDQFAWAIALHEVVFGARPFPGESSEEISAAVLRNERRPWRRGHGVPPWLLAILDRALAPRPRDRFATMAAVVDAVERGPARWRRWIAVPVVAVIAGSAIALASDPTRDVGGCEVLAGFEPELRDEVLAAFGSDARRGAAVVAQLEAQGTAIALARRAACAAHDRGQLDRDALDRQLACLEGRSLHLDSFARAVAGAGGDALDAAQTAVRSLPAVATCSEGEAEPPVPADPVLAAQVIALRGRLAESAVYRQLGRGDTALSLAREAEREARALGYPPVLAEAMLGYGESASNEGELELAEQRLRDAAWLAEVEGQGRVLVEARTELAWLRVVALRHYDEVDALVASAEAAAQRVGDPGYRAILLNVRAAAQAARGERPAALATMQEVVTLLRRDDANALTLANALHNLGNYQLLEGELDGATASYDEALEIAAAALGDEHPDTEALRQALADARLMAHDFTAAVPAYRAVLEAREARYGPDDPRLASTLNNLGHALVELGRADEARAALERALRLKLAADASPASLGNTCVMLGRALTDLGRVDDALGMLGQAAIHRSDLAPEASESIEVADAIEAAVARASTPLSIAGREVVAAAARRALLAGDGARAARLHAALAR